MAIEIKVPSVGESVTEGTLARWLKKDGESVRADEPVVELETEKATTELPAPAAGVLRIAVPEGQTITIGTVVGRIEEDGRQASSAAQPARDVKREEKSSTAPDGKTASAAPGDRPAAASLSPSARKLAEERRIDVSALSGTGRGGRITKEDVLALRDRPGQPAPASATAAPSEPARNAIPSAPPAAPAGETRQRMSPIRQRIAERLLRSRQETAVLTTFNEADMSAVLDVRARYKDRFKERHGVGLGFMSFFVKACVEALRAYPVVNARIDGGDIVHPNAYHIGVAVSTERGLMVPVLRDADRLNFAEIEKQIAALAARARDGKISVTDLQGGTFTITNGGIFGSLLSTPILNPPQSGILGMHSIQKRPMAVGDQVVVRPMMYLALSYDHRLVDGRDAVLFLVRVKECIEDPERLLLEV
jgi:2-oxoglutarate dehydrogenase E2 component (dihydrolipoamide succinyltransferase)